MAHACRFSDVHEKLSRWTRSLKIDFLAKGEQSSNLAVETAVTIALHSRQLAELDVGCFAPPEGLLAAVASVAFTSLRVLDLSVQYSPGIPAGMLSCIGTFPRLHTLRLKFFESDQTIPTWPAVLDLDEVGGWTLRDLEKLEINLEEISDGDHHQLLRFLSRSVLGKPNTLHLVLWGLASEDAHALEDFFHVHTALCQVQLFGGETDVSDVALLHADTEYLMLQSFPSTHTALSFSPRLRTFCLATYYAGEFPPLELLMTALADHRSPDAEPLEFQMKYLGGRRFRWTDEHFSRASDLAQDQAALLGRMYFCAHRLRPRGLVVLDGNGYTVEGSRFERPGERML
jgi:hypothetical protein